MSDTGPMVSGPIAQSVDRLRREFERWVDAVLHQGNRALDVVGLRNSDRPWSPQVDVMETSTEVLVDVDLAGVEPGLVDVSLAGNMLTIQGPKRLASTPDADLTVHLSERNHGPFQRSIPMPAPVVAEGVTAELKNGVLKLRLLKSERARAMKIPVRTKSTGELEPAAHPI